MAENSVGQPRGRPRLFDEEKVLDKAIELFSSAGYSAPGMNDLSRVTGLKVGSIYKAWQSKEHFFASALRRYIALREAQITAALAQQKDGRARIAALLHIYVRLSQGKEGALGCLMVAGIAEKENFSFVSDILREQIASRRRTLGDLVTLGQHDGSIASGTPPAIVADLLIALLYGMRILGKAEAFVTEAEAEAWVSSALKVLD